MPDFVNGGHNNNALGGSTSIAVTIPGTVAGHDLLVVSSVSDEAASNPPLTTTVLSVAVTAGPAATFSLLKTFRTPVNTTFGPTLFYVATCEIWRATGIPAGITEVTVTWTNTVGAVVTCGEYAGVRAIGALTTNAVVAVDPEISLTTQAPGNLVVAGFAGAEPATGPFTAKTGVLRENDRSSGFNSINALGALVDNASAPPASVTDAVTHGSSQGELSTAMIAVELMWGFSGGAW